METKPTQTIEELLTASNKVNQMKEDIERIVGMTFGCIDHSEREKFKNNETVCEFFHHGINWVIFANNGNSDWGLRCLDVKNQNKVYVFIGNGGSLKFEWVRPIHEALELFLSEMINKFPELQNHFDLLMYAAA